MNRSLRRKFDKEYQTLLRTKGDNCSIFGRAFQHNDRTFGGFKANEKVAVVGDCCKSRLTAIYAGGVFSTRNNVAAKAGTTSAAAAPMLSADELDRAVSGMQAHFDGLDDFSAQGMRQAGVASSKERADISFAPTPWKEDDAAWFAAHPDRSHRMRPMFAGEFAKIEEELQNPPGHHEFQTLIRQLEPGKRIRTPFCRDTRTEIPDLEPILHAMYDLVSKKSDTTRVVPVAEVAELAMKYAKASDDNGSAKLMLGKEVPSYHKP